MKTIIMTFIGLLLINFGYSQTNIEIVELSSIEFHSAPWKEVLSKSEKENKPIFLDISTGWCGYCKKMKTKTYTDPHVAEFYNENFINVSIDAEKGEGPELAKKYGANGYPSFVFLNSDGSISHMTSGYRSNKEFLKLGEDVLNKK